MSELKPARQRLAILRVVRRAFVIFAFVCLSALAVAQHLDAALTSQDLRAAESWYSTFINRYLIFKHETLLNATQFVAPGVRGYEYYPAFEMGATPFTGDHQKDSVILLGREACQAQAIVVAKVESSRGFFFENYEGILTAHKIEIEKTIKGDISAGNTITALEFGGAVEKGGKSYRVYAKNVKPFEDDKKYILFLNKSSQFPSEAYFIDPDASSETDGGGIVSRHRESDSVIDNPMRNGETVDDFADRVIAAEKARGCK